MSGILFRDVTQCKRKSDGHAKISGDDLACGTDRDSPLASRARGRKSRGGANRPGAKSGVREMRAL